jgi:hypothetical protein
MHARLTEAAAFYGEGNRSIIHVGVVFSDSYVTFIKPSPSFLTKLKFEMPDVPWIVFEQQLKTIETEATRRVEQKLLAACYNFLGERQGEPLGHEEQAIVDTLFELMKPRHVTHGLQDGWDQLCRRGIKTYAALLAIEESWGVTLLEEPCDNPDQVSSEVEEDAKVA